MTSIDQKEVEEFEKKLKEKMENIKPITCNILVIGQTGSGKSSFIKKLFGMEISKGIGEITKTFECYDSKDLNLRIYDSKGITRSDDNYFLELEKFLKTTEIHVVWIMIDCSSYRIEGFYKEICQVLKDYLVLFLLNKIDLLTQNEVEILRQELKNLEIENCKGIFSTRVTNSIPNIHECILCKSNMLLIDNHEELIICKNCKFEMKWSDFQNKDELKELIEKTVQIVPIQQKVSFIANQKVNIEIKREKALEYISNFNSSLLYEVGLFDPNLKKSELIVGLYRIYGLYGEVDLTYLSNLNQFISNLTGIVSLGPIGEIIKCGTKISFFYYYSKALNDLLYDTTKKILNK